MNTSANLIHAWRLTKGSKTALWTASFAWVAIAAVILLFAWLMRLFIPPAIALHPLTLLSLTWIIIAVTAPLFAGMNMIAIKRARGESVLLRTGFQYFHQWLPLAGAFILIALISAAFILAFTLVLNYLVWVPGLILTSISVLLFNLIYALLIFVIPLISDQHLPVFKALNQSLSIAKAHWLKLFALLMIFYVLNLLSLLACEIPYAGLICYIIISIWLIPFIFMNIGVAYHQLVDKKS